MQKDVILGLVRHALTGAGFVVVSKGIADQGIVTEGIGALMTLFSIAWSVADKKKRA